MIKLRLYIMKGYPGSITAESNLLELRKLLPNHKVDIEVIDILKNPEKAEADNILAAPTLVILNPGPVRKLIGSFSNKNKIIEQLNIDKSITEDS